MKKLLERLRKLLRRATALATIALLLLSTSLSQAQAAAIQSGDVLLVPISDAREIITDNAALVAEVSELRSALTQERELHGAQIQAAQSQIADAKSQIEAQNRIISANKKDNAQKIIIALIIGAVIGACAR